jgi:hypothetical protein
MRLYAGTNSDEIAQMSTPNDDLNKKLNWNGSGAAAEDEEPNMPLQQPNKMSMQQPNMQQMEDPNKISARTNQSRGPTQQESFGRDLSGNPRADPRLPSEMQHRGQAFGIPGPAGAEPGTQAPSTRLNGSNVNGKFASLIALLDALEAVEQNGGELDEDEEFPGPIAIANHAIGTGPAFLDESHVVAPQLRHDAVVFVPGPVLVRAASESFPLFVCNCSPTRAAPSPSRLPVAMGFGFSPAFAPPFGI